MVFELDLIKKRMRGALTVKELRESGLIEGSIKSEKLFKWYN